MAVVVVVVVVVAAVSLSLPLSLSLSLSLSLFRAPALSRSVRRLMSVHKVRRAQMPSRF